MINIEMDRDDPDRVDEAVRENGVPEVEPVYDIDHTKQKPGQSCRDHTGRTLVGMRKSERNGSHQDGCPRRYCAGPQQPPHSPDDEATKCKLLEEPAEQAKKKKK